MRAWYEQSFGSDYLIVYKHRDLQGAKEEVNRMIKWLDLPPRSEIFDLCCGMGRHSMALVDSGYKVTGLDLSKVLLDEARKLDAERKVTWIEGDMRNVPLNTSFDAVVNLFTSFGYFDTDIENMKVLNEMDRLLKPEGKFIIDFLNGALVREQLVPHSVRSIDGMTIEESRTIENQFVKKRIVIKEEALPERKYFEQVKLYSLDDFQGMLSETRLIMDHVYGNYLQSPYLENESPRLIIVGHKQKDLKS